MTRQHCPSRSRLDFLVPLLMAAVLLGSCVLTSRQKPFWFDEILTHYFVTDPSLAHMLTAQADLINASPPLYFLLARLWTQAFGTTELAFRMLSSVGCITGCAVIWWVLRRTYGSWPAGIAAIVVLMSSRHLLYNNAEARFYGVLFAELAAGVCLYVRLCRQTRPGVGTLLANAAVHAALVTTHYFGLFFSGTLLAAFFVSHRRDAQKLVPCFVSIVLGWGAFLPCLPAFFHHQQLGGPFAWFGRPGMMDLAKVYTTNDELPGFLALTFAGLAIRVQRSSNGATERNDERAAEHAADPGIRAALVLALGLGTLPAWVWVYSQFVTPVFLDRYLWPVVVTAWCLVAAHATWHILGKSKSASFAAGRFPIHLTVCLPKLAMELLCVLCLLVPFQLEYHAPEHHREFLGRFSELHGAMPRNLPVVFEDPRVFLECKFHYESDKEYVLLLDKDWSLRGESRSPANRRLQPGFFLIQSALQRQYGIQAVPPREFLAQHDRFVFVPTHGELFDKWIRFNGEYSWTRSNGARWHFYVVSRQAGSSPDAGRAESRKAEKVSGQSRLDISNR